MSKKNTSAYIMFMVWMSKADHGLFRASHSHNPAHIPHFRGVFGTLFLLCYVKLRGKKVRNGIPRRAVLSYIAPVSAIFWSAALLWELMTPKSLLGAVLIIGSALTCELLPGNAAEKAAEG